MLAVQYLPIFVFIALGVGFGIVPLIAGFVVGPRRPDAAKLSSYECGFEPFSHARAPFDVRFYLVAILFILFDLETAFLFPWAVTFRQMGRLGFVSVLCFLGLLLLGLVYEWRKGALEWE